MSDSLNKPDPYVWHLMSLLVISAAWESLFLTIGLNPLDESWPLYAAMRLHEGGTLFADVMWNFPPLHVVPAWIAWSIDPPGIIEARAIYAAFNVALVGALYSIGRRFMGAHFAFLGALLLAIAAPLSHAYQVLYGYRYLVIPVLALLALDRRLTGGGRGWIATAGALTGLALCFRLTPAFAVACGVAVALFTATTRDPRRWFVDGLLFTAGLVVVVAPLLAWFHTTVGLPRLWQEVVLHPMAMLQPVPPPAIVTPDLGDRKQIRDWFVAVQFRAYWFLYGAYLIGLAGFWVRALVQRRPFNHALLLAFVVFGGVYFVRSLGRSDGPHLDSAIPPICLLIAHMVWLLVERIWPEGRSMPERKAFGALTLATAVVAAWIYLPNADGALSPRARGLIPVASTDGEITVVSRRWARKIDHVVKVIGRRTKPGDQILNMSPTPLFHILSGRTGPGYSDIVMPGTFFSREDETEFLVRVAKDPPSVVIWPRKDFDGMPERSVERQAPKLSSWVKNNYRPTPGPKNGWPVMIPRAPQR